MPLGFIDGKLVRIGIADGTMVGRGVGGKVVGLEVSALLGGEEGNTDGRTAATGSNVLGLTVGTARLGTMDGTAVGLEVVGRQDGFNVGEILRTGKEVDFKDGALEGMFVFILEGLLDGEEEVIPVVTYLCTALLSERYFGVSAKGCIWYSLNPQAPYFE